MLRPQGVIEDMDRLKIDMSVVPSAAVIAPLYWAEPSVALGLARQLNDTAAEWAAASPKRIIGSFVLPLQDVDMALIELKRAVGDLGLKVANIPAEVRGIYLGDARFRPFWEAAEELGAAIFMHPDGAKDPWFSSGECEIRSANRLRKQNSWHRSSMKGFLRPIPGSSSCFGGGDFPHNMGRLDRNVKNAPQSMKDITRKPSEFLKNVYYDTCLYDPTVLSALAKIVGPERLLLGSDWPIGEADPIGFVDRCPNFDESGKRVMKGGRTLELVGIAG